MTDINIKFEQYRIYLADALDVFNKRIYASAVGVAINALAVMVTILRLNGVSDFITLSLSSCFVIVNINWYQYLGSCCKLSTAKFSYVLEMEKDLPYKPYTTEWDRLEAQNYTTLTSLDKRLPMFFGGIWTIIGLSALVLEFLSLK